jgi:glycosyltransferase involved in cell wall biosynthesis
VRKFLEDNFPIIPNEKIADLVEGRVTSFANRCDAVIATTKTFEKELKKRYKSPVYYNSTAGLTKTMKLNENKKVVRKRLNLPADKTILLNVSRQAVEKNLELLIETYAKLNKSKYHLVLVGSGPHTKNLKNFAKKLKIYKSITFPGRKLQEELPEFYSASDIFLYSSNTDTIGINILEAMSAGLPVIAVKDPSTAEVVKHNKNGFLVQAQTLDFVKSINKLNNSKKGYQIMATNAIKTAEKFKVEGTTTGLVSIYKKIVSG